MPANAAQQHAVDTTYAMDRAALRAQYETLNRETLPSREAFASLIDNGYVAPSPGEAIRRLIRAYTAIPNRLGTNCSGFLELRRAICHLAGADYTNYVNALILMVPHTHWDPDIVVQTLDARGDRYWIGPQEGTPPFYAVSFVFHQDGPVPYEWADASCGLRRADLMPLWDFLERLNAAVVSSPWFLNPHPIGITINHRFKRPFETPLSSTHESPSQTEAGLSMIERAPSALDLRGTAGDQVGWPAALIPDLNDQELSAVQELEQILGTIPTEKARQVVDKLLS